MAGLAVAAAPVVHRQRGVVRLETTLTTDATADGGDVASTVIGAAFGRIVGLFYNGGGDASGVLTFTDYVTGATLFTYTLGAEGTPTRINPKTNIVDTAGVTVAAALEAVDVWRDIKVAGKIALSVANMGVSESAKVALIIDEKGIGELALVA